MPTLWPALHSEALLVALILLLYLKDSLLLLGPDEAVLRHGPRGPWRVGFGARNFKLAGREPYLMHPFKPHEAVWRLRWRMVGAAATTPSAEAAKSPAKSKASAKAKAEAPAAALLQAPAELARLAPCVWCLWGLLFIALPATLLGRLGLMSTLAVVAAIYLCLATALALVWRWRSRLGLSRRAAGLLAFECLACAPYGANLLRRVAAAMAVQEDFVPAAERLLAPPELAAVRHECLARIDEQLDAEPEASARAQSLRLARQRFGADAPAINTTHTEGTA